MWKTNHEKTSLLSVSKLDALDAILDVHSTRDSILEAFEFRGSRREVRVSRDCQLTFARYCICTPVRTCILVKECEFITSANVDFFKEPGMRLVNKT